MKKIVIPAVLVLILAALPLLAHHPAGKSGYPGHHGHGREMGGPDMMATHILALGDELGLSEQQKSEIEAVLAEARPQIEALRLRMEKAREEWQENFDPANFDEATARSFAESQAAIHADLMVLGMKTRAQVFSLLTPEQQGQLRNLREEGGPGGCTHHGKSPRHRGCKKRS